MTSDEKPVPDLETEQLLEQGDALLESSRRLLDDLEAVVPTDPAADPASAPEST